MKGKKITTSNYFDTVEKIGFENLPLVLKQSHMVLMTKTDNGRDWALYSTDKGLKRMIDLAFKKLEEYIVSAKAGLNGAKDYLSPRDVAIKLVEPAFEKSDTMLLLPHSKHTISSPDYAAHIENGKIIVTMLYGTSIREAFEIDDILEEVTKNYLNKFKQNEHKSTPTTSRKKRTTYQHKQPEFKVLKAILNWHNQTVSKKQVEYFIDELQQYIKSAQITKDSVVAQDIQLVQEKLLSIFNSMDERIKVELSSETKKIFQEALKKVTDISKDNISKRKRGLDGINEIPKELEGPDIINSIDFTNLQFNTIGFKGKWLVFIGDPTPGFTAMVFAMPKMGKTFLCVDFASYLAKNHGRVLYISKEEFMSPTLATKFKDKNAASENIDISGTVPGDLSPYQFVFIDSVTSLKLTPDDLLKLKMKYPKTSFIYVFQVTKTGSARGTNEFMHNVDFVIEIPQKGKAVQFGRFNQGGELNIFPDTTIGLTSEDNVSMLAGLNDKKMNRKDKTTSFPSWTTPKHLNERDHYMLKHIYSLYKAGKLNEAYDYALNVGDTMIREEIPGDVWMEIGGKLTPSGEEKLKTKRTAEEIHAKIQSLTEVINKLSKEKNPNWGTVGSFANLHESLGTRIFEDYKKHEGYSKSVEEGIKRHTYAIKLLLKKLSKKIDEFYKQGSISDLQYWNGLLNDQLESHQTIEPETKKSNRKLLTPSSKKVLTINTELGIPLAELVSEMILKNKPKEDILDLIYNKRQKVEETVEILAQQAIIDESLKIKVKSVKFKENDSDRISHGTSYYKVVLEGTKSELKKIAGPDKLFYCEWNQL